MGEWCDTTDPQARESSKALHDHFKQWCEERGHEHVMNPTAFGRALRDKHFKVKKDGKGVRWRLGIKLRTEGLFVSGAASSQSAGSLPPLGADGVQPAVPNSQEDDDVLPP
jgi:putative DNA primase/helicase